VFLHDVQDHGHEDDGGDDAEARHVAGEGRHAGGAEQDQDQRVAEPAEEGGQQAARRRRVDLVRPDRLENGRCIGTAQPGCGGMQRRQKVGQRAGSLVRLYRPPKRCGVGVDRLIDQQATRRWMPILVTGAPDASMASMMRPAPPRFLPDNRGSKLSRSRMNGCKDVG
jgi:hypothetical protein